MRPPRMRSGWMEGSARIAAPGPTPKRTFAVASIQCEPFALGRRAQGDVRFLLAPPHSLGHPIVLKHEHRLWEWTVAEPHFRKAAREPSRKAPRKAPRNRPEKFFISTRKPARKPSEKLFKWPRKPTENLFRWPRKPPEKLFKTRDYVTSLLDCVIYEVFRARFRITGFEQFFGRFSEPR